MQARMFPFVRFKFRVLSFKLIFSATTIAFSQKRIFACQLFFRFGFSREDTIIFFCNEKKELYDSCAVLINIEMFVQPFIKVSSLRNALLVVIIILCVTLENCMHDCTHERIEKKERKSKDVSPSFFLSFL